MLFVPLCILSCFGFSALTILSPLSCFGFSALTILSPLSCFGFSALTILSPLSCFGIFALTILSRIFCDLLSYSVYPVQQCPRFLYSFLSSSIFSVLAILTVLVLSQILVLAVYTQVHFNFSLFTIFSCLDSPISVPPLLFLPGIPVFYVLPLWSTTSPMGFKVFKKL